MEKKHTNFNDEIDHYDDKYELVDWFVIAAIVSIPFGIAIIVTELII